MHQAYARDPPRSSWSRRPLVIILQKADRPKRPIAELCDTFLLNGCSLPQLRTHFHCPIFGFSGSDEPSWVSDEITPTDILHQRHPTFLMLCPQDDLQGEKPADQHTTENGSSLWNAKCKQILWTPRIPSGAPILSASNTATPRRLFSEDELQFIISVALDLEFKTPDEVFVWLGYTLNMLDHIQETRNSKLMSAEDRFSWWMTVFALAKVSQLLKM